jgi:hypothetical protein
MSHEVFTVEFEDGRRLYGVVDTMTGHHYRFLFDTAVAGKDWIFSAYDESTGHRVRDRVELPEPSSAIETQESVTLNPENAEWSMASRASWVARWLTGPADSDELLSEAGYDY